MAQQPSTQVISDCGIKNESCDSLVWHLKNIHISVKLKQGRNSFSLTLKAATSTGIQENRTKQVNLKKKKEKKSDLDCSL